MAEHYRVKIKENDFEIEVESSSKKYVDDMLKKYFDSKSPEHDDPCTPIVKSGKPKAERSGKQLSIQEFINDVKPKSGREYVCAVAYYKETYEGAKEFFTKDISEIFQSIKYKSANVSNDVSRARSKGYLMDGTSKKSFQVSSTGQKFIESKLEANEKDSK